MKKKYLILIQGPTAVGKTSAAISLADYFKTEIISSDSRQFYKELNIGVARPSPEELAMAKHHFIAHISIHDYYSVSKFEKEVLAFLDVFFKQNDVVIMAGGSGLYNDVICNGIDELPDPDPVLREALKKRLETEGQEALRQELKRLDPEFYEVVDLNNPKRVLRAVEVCLQTGKKYSALRSKPDVKRPFHIIKTGLELPREILNERIHRRVDKMMEEGLEAEARGLFEYRYLNALNTVGYKELFRYFEGEWTLETAVEKIKTNTRRFAKRQMTWFRKDKETQWFSPDNLQALIAHCESLM